MRSFNPGDIVKHFKRETVKPDNCNNEYLYQKFKLCIKVINVIN